MRIAKLPQVTTDKTHSRGLRITYTNLIFISNLDRTRSFNIRVREDRTVRIKTPKLGTLEKISADADTGKNIVYDRIFGAT